MCACNTRFDLTLISFFNLIIWHLIKFKNAKFILIESIDKIYQKKLIYHCTYNILKFELNKTAHCSKLQRNHFSSCKTHWYTALFMMNYNVMRIMHTIYFYLFCSNKNIVNLPTTRLSGAPQKLMKFLSGIPYSKPRPRQAKGKPSQSQGKTKPSQSQGKQKPSQSQGKQN